MCNGFSCIVTKTGDIKFIEPDINCDISHGEILTRANMADTYDAFNRPFVRIEFSNWTEASFHFDEPPTLPGWVDETEIKERCVKLLNRVSPIVDIFRTEVEKLNLAFRKKTDKFTDRYQRRDDAINDKFQVQTDKISLIDDTVIRVAKQNKLDEQIDKLFDANENRYQARISPYVTVRDNKLEIARKQMIKALSPITGFVPEEA